MSFVTATFRKNTRSVKCEIPLITPDIITLLKLMFDNANGNGEASTKAVLNIEGINPKNYVVTEPNTKTIVVQAPVSYYETMLRVMPLIHSIEEKLAMKLGKDFVAFQQFDVTLTIKAIVKSKEDATKLKKKFFIESIDKDGLTPIYWASKDGWVSEADGIVRTLYAAEKTAKKVIPTDCGSPIKISSIMI